MNIFRTGDAVLIELSADVVGTVNGLVRVRFGDIEYDAEPSSLIMVRRSMHEGDEILHNQRRGVITQKLEDDVFLVHFAGAAGAGAYGVIARDGLSHAEREEVATPLAIESEQGLPEEIAAAEFVTGDPAPTTPVTPSEPLELTTDYEQFDDVEPSFGSAPAKTKSSLLTETRAMASGLEGIIERSRQRRNPLDLSSIGVTETIRQMDEVDVKFAGPEQR